MLRRRKLDRFGVLTGVGIVLTVDIAGCRTPTSIQVVVTTDVPCERGLTTTIQVGRFNQGLEQKDPGSVTTTCVDGRIGSLVVVPAGAEDDDIGIRVLTAVAPMSLEGCANLKDPHCIVARRTLRFLPHQEMNVPVFMSAKCLGHACTEATTCVRGNGCKPTSIKDPTSCTAPEGCDEPALDVALASDASPKTRQIGAGPQ